jgi:hypothetical protein
LSLVKSEPGPPARGAPGISVMVPLQDEAGNTALLVSGLHDVLSGLPLSPYEAAETRVP